MSGQLDALLAETWERPWEILVVDNGSTDGTATLAARYARRDPRVRAVDASARAGLSHARNVGVAAARGSTVAFVDDDDRVGEGWVAAIGRALAEHQLVASRMDYELLNDPAADPDRAPFQSAGIETLFGRPVVHGAGSGWQRALWEAIGGNDESIDFTGEDYDAVFRAADQRGAEPYFCAAATYHCARRRGIKPTFRQARRYGIGGVYLYRAYGRHADAAGTTSRAARQWLWLVLHVGDLRHDTKALAWARLAGTRLGRIQGSIRFRTVFL
jgi:glycosyltransferase involved in cell wall biosynthesis